MIERNEMRKVSEPTKETLGVLGEARECNHDLILALKDRLNA
jgi:hypothetical protein